MDTQPTPAPESAPAPEAYKPSSGLKAGRFGDLADKLKKTYLRLAFEHEGQEFAVSVRRLTSSEVDAADKHVRGVTPPVKDEKAETLGDKYDFENADYQAALQKARGRQVAELLDRAIEPETPGAGGIPAGAGAGIDAKVDWLYENIPSNVLSLLVQKVVEISTRGVADRAAFF